MCVYMYVCVYVCTHVWVCKHKSKRYRPWLCVYVCVRPVTRQPPLLLSMHTVVPHLYRNQSVT